MNLGMKRESMRWWRRRWSPEGRGENYCVTWRSDPFMIVWRERQSSCGYTVIKMPHASLRRIGSHHPFIAQHKRTVNMDICSKRGACRRLRLLQSSSFSQLQQSNCINQSNTSTFDVSIFIKIIRNTAATLGEANSWNQGRIYVKGRRYAS